MKIEVYIKREDKDYLIGSFPNVEIPYQYFILENGVINKKKFEINILELYGMFGYVHFYTYKLQDEINRINKMSLLITKESEVKRNNNKKLIKECKRVNDFIYRILYTHSRETLYIKIT